MDTTSPNQNLRNQPAIVQLQVDSRHYSSPGSQEPGKLKLKSQKEKKHMKHFPLKLKCDWKFKDDTSQREGHETRVLWSHGLTSNREMSSLWWSLVPTIFKTMGIVSLLHFRPPSSLAATSSIVILIEFFSVTHHCEKL